MNNKIPTLLLTPWLISQKKPIISFLNIEKNGKLINFTTIEFTRPEVSKAMKNYPAPLKDLLMDCCMEELEEIAVNSKFRLANGMAGVSFDDLLAKNLIIHWHKIFEALKPFSHLIKWYYKKEQPGKKTLLTAP
mgnify:FL=1